MNRPKRTIKKPKAIYEPDPNVKLEGDYSEDSDFDLDELDDLSSEAEILTSDEESEADGEYIDSITKKDEYQKDDFLVSDNESLGEFTGSDSEASWHSSDEDELITSEEEIEEEEKTEEEVEEEKPEEMDLDE